MAARYATKSGNWSDVTVWDGGTTLPGSDDDVRPNNFVVNIDQDVSVRTLRSDASSPVVAGGNFTITGTGVNLSITTTAGLGGSASGTTGGLLVISGTGTVTINGVVSGGVASNRIGVNVTSGVTLIVNGTVQGSSGSGAAGITLGAGSGSIVTVNGDISGGSGNASYGLGVTGAANSILTVNGTVTGGSNASGQGVYMTNGTNQGIFNGTIVGGSGSTAYGVYWVNSVVRIDARLVYGSNGCAPIHGLSAVMFKRTGEYLSMEAPSDDNWPAATGTPIIVERYTTGNPLPEDVRAGVAYGPEGTSTGTAVIPAAASVLYGVPVDDTTGTALVNGGDPQVIVDAVTAEVLPAIAASEDIITAGIDASEAAVVAAVAGSESDVVTAIASSQGAIVTNVTASRDTVVNAVTASEDAVLDAVATVGSDLSIAVIEMEADLVANATAETNRGAQITNEIVVAATDG